MSGLGDYVLVVDDDDGIRETVVEILAGAGMAAFGAGTGTAALRLAHDDVPTLAVVDHRLPDMTGRDVVAALKALDPELPILIVTGFATLESAVAAVGVADEYLTKPVRPERIVAAVESRLERRRLARENRELSERLHHANRRLEATLAARTGELEATLAVTSALAAAPPGGALSALLRAVGEATGARGVAFYRAGEDGSLRLDRSVGDWQPPSTLDPHDGVSTDALGEPRRWSTSVPVRAGGAALGALVLADERRDGLHLLRMLALLAVAALRADGHDVGHGDGVVPVSRRSTESAARHP